jgi:hypothetical protein
MKTRYSELNDSTYPKESTQFRSNVSHFVKCWFLMRGDIKTTAYSQTEGPTRIAC